MLNDIQKQIIQETYRQMSVELMAVGQRFYHHLFRLYPDVRPMFGENTSAQSMKLMQTIGFAVSHLNSPETLRPVLESLGQRHIDYGVQTHHYQLVGEALLITLEEMLGSDFTPDAKIAWETLYEELVETVTHAA
jgi:hemoglobin-like flavoprotein